MPWYVALATTAAETDDVSHYAWMGGARNCMATYNLFRIYKIARIIALAAGKVLNLKPLLLFPLPRSFRVRRLFREDHSKLEFFAACGRSASESWAPSNEASRPCPRQLHRCS